jgi:DNA processing protein
LTPAATCDAERLARLRLARTESVGPVTYAALIKRCGTAVRALEALPDLSRRGGRTAPIRIPSIAEIEQEFDKGAKAGATLLTLGDASFPHRLAALDPPPPILWIIGHAAILSRPAVAVVGARIASSGGQRFARQLANDLGEAGFLVVSGLARGIDGAAHDGSLRTGTAAVLGGGVDDIYPPEHAALHKRIGVEGCLVSESPVGHRAQAKDFPRRNRIISGLSLGVVVVEAEMRSGSLITARLAGEQGRDVFAVPGSPLDPRARGTNDLIRQGAILCEGIEDVVRNLTPDQGVREPQGDLFAPAPSDEAALNREADRLRERAFALTSFTPTPIDEIVRSLAAPAPAVFAALVELSLAERVDLLPGALVARR